MAGRKKVTVLEMPDAVPLEPAPEAANGHGEGKKKVSFGWPELGKPRLRREREPIVINYADRKKRHEFRLLPIEDLDEALAAGFDLSQLDNLEEEGPEDGEDWGGNAPAGGGAGDSLTDRALGGRSGVNEVLGAYQGLPLAERSDVPLPMVVIIAWTKVREASAYMSAHPGTRIFLPAVFDKWFLRLRIGVGGAGADRFIALASQGLARQGQADIDDDDTGMSLR